MLIAGVDIGSNTLRLLLARVDKGELYPLKYARAITRLAGGLGGGIGGAIGKAGNLSNEARERSLEVLRDWAQIIKTQGAGFVRCVGTSALRDATNSPVFLEQVKKLTGLDIEIISEEEEARLTTLGVFSSNRPDEGAVIIDIGGGSTEFTLTRDGEVLRWGSVPEGAVRMAEAVGPGDPPGDRDLALFYRRADEVSQAVLETLKDEDMRGLRLIGTAGTICTLAAMQLGLRAYDRARVHGHLLKIDWLKTTAAKLAAATLSERATIKGLDPARADLIMPGIILTISLMEALGFKEMQVSNSGLLEGVVLGLASASGSPEVNLTVETDN